MPNGDLEDRIAPEPRSVLVVDDAARHLDKQSPEDLVRDVTAYVPSEREELHCSFCGKSRENVKKLIAGPRVFICDECVWLCAEVLEKERVILDFWLGGIAYKGTVPDRPNTRFWKLNYRGYDDRKLIFPNDQDIVALATEHQLGPEFEIIAREPSELIVRFSTGTREKNRDRFRRALASKTIPRPLEPKKK